MLVHVLHSRTHQVLSLALAHLRRLQVVSCMDEPIIHRRVLFLDHLPRALLDNLGLMKLVSNLDASLVDRLAP